MLTVKMQDIVHSAEVIRDICGPRGKCLEPKTARYLGVTVGNAVEVTMRDFDNARNDIIKGYGCLNGDGVPEVPRDEYEDFNREIGALLEQSRDLLHLSPIAEEKLAPLALTPVEWRVLDWLIEPREHAAD